MKLIRYGEAGQENPGVIINENIYDVIEIVSDFTVNTDDFGIEIPSVVSKKVTKKVNVRFEFVLK